jgi:uncharacterized protein (DUF305 family)
MKRGIAGVSALAVLVTAACASSRPTSQTTTSATAAVSPAQQARNDSSHPAYTPADVHFIAGMIGHHAQAIQMAGWCASHNASPSLRPLCERIVVGQNDEIAFAQRWLRERGEYVPPADPRGHIMQGSDMPMLMPGMLTPQQMTQLDAARGREFDRLFLQYMIMHHQGAITMVQQLLAAPGAAQDGPVFRFASDVNADQTTEINRMTLMLDNLKRSSQ